MGRQIHRQEVSQRQKGVAQGLLLTALDGHRCCLHRDHLPAALGHGTRNTSRTRVFLRPLSVSPFRSLGTSEFRSFRIPAQSAVEAKEQKASRPI